MEPNTHQSPSDCKKSETQNTFLEGQLLQYMDVLEKQSETMDTMLADFEKVNSKKRKLQEIVDATIKVDKCIQKLEAFTQHVEAKLANTRIAIDETLKKKETEYETKLALLEVEIKNLKEDAAKKIEEKKKKRKLHEAKEELKSKYEQAHKAHIEKIEKFLDEHDQRIGVLIETSLEKLVACIKQIETQTSAGIAEIKQQGEQEFKKLHELVEKNRCPIPLFTMPEIESGK